MQLTLAPGGWIPGGVPRPGRRGLRLCELHRRNLEEVKIEREAFERFTAPQVQTVFKKYYTPTRKFQVTATSTQAEGAKEKAREETARLPSS